MARTPRFRQSDANPIGMFVESMLTEAQFQALNGTSWVLADGRSVVGSKYAEVTGNTNAPDARGLFLRAKNNGRADSFSDPDGEKQLGLQSTDKLKSHSHNLYVSTAGGDGNYRAIYPTRGVGGDDNPPVWDGSGLVDVSGQNETSPKSLTVNIFIKINS